MKTEYRLVVTYQGKRAKVHEKKTLEKAEKALAEHEADQFGDRSTPFTRESEYHLESREVGEWEPL